MKKPKITLEKLAELINDFKKRFDFIDKQFEDLTLSTKQGFDAVDKRFEIVDKKFESINFKFTIIDDRFRDVDKRFDRLESKFDQLNNELHKTNDSFTQLKNYNDCEFAAVRGHLIRVDEKIGLAST